MEQRQERTRWVYLGVGWQDKCTQAKPGIVVYIVLVYIYISQNSVYSPIMISSGMKQCLNAWRWSLTAMYVGVSRGEAVGGDRRWFSALLPRHFVGVQPWRNDLLTSSMGWPTASGGSIPPQYRQQMVFINHLFLAQRWHINSDYSWYLHCIYLLR